MIRDACISSMTVKNDIEMKISNPNFKGDQPWDFFGSNDAEAEGEIPVLWPPHAKS